jgi:hypothetical protein
VGIDVMKKLESENLNLKRELDGLREKMKLRSLLDQTEGTPNNQ